MGNMCEELVLIEIIKYLLNKNETKGTVSNIPEDFDWTKLLQIAVRHNVGNLPYHILTLLPKSVQPEEKIRSYMRKLAVQAAVLYIKQQAEEK